MSSHADTGPFTWVWDHSGVEQLKEAIRTAQEVVWDTETTGLDAYAVEGGKRNGGVGSRQVLATFTLPQPDEFGEWDGTEPTTWILPLSHPESPFTGNWRAVSRDIALHILALKKSVIGHNVKFDLKYQRGTTDVNLASCVTWDSADASRIMEQRQKADLASCASRAFGIPTWKDFDFSKPGAAETYPIFELGEYGARDTYWTWRLKRYQRERMFLTRDADEPFGTDEILDARSGKLAELIGMPTVASLSNIEQNGFLLDEEFTRKHVEESSQISAEALEKIAHLYEDKWLKNPEKVRLNPAHVSTAPTSHWFRDFMNQAVEEGDAQILSLTKTGKPQWSKGVLGKLTRARGEDSVPALVLEQRKHSKRLEFLTSWLYSSTSRTHKVHCTYSTGMSTGRLSSSGPNMQQVTKDLRPCFIPREGYVIADFDFSQIELRIAAFIARCLPMLEAFNAGKDLHKLLASQVMGVAEEQVGKDSRERQLAKAVNFGLLFGLGVHGLQGYAEDAYGVTMSRQEATEFYHGYFRTWVGLKEWHAQVEARLMRDGRSVSPLGRVRNFTQGSTEGLNAAINAPVQGMASDLMQLVIADIQGFLPVGVGRGAVENIAVVGTVHDSAVIELPVDNWHAKALEVKERMENVNPLLKHLGVELDVPIVVEATVGTRWSWKDVGEI